MGVIRNVVRGKYTVTLKDSNNNIKFESTFDNLLTDAALDLLAKHSNSAYLNHGMFYKAALGTGVSEPQPTDTNLTNRSAFSAQGTGAGFTYELSSPRVKKSKIQYAFNPGVATGTWSEVGVFYSNGDVLHSKTLIKDGGGAPTTITKAATDYLYITYEFQQYIPTADVVGTIVLDGITYNYTARPTNLDRTVQAGDAGFYYTVWNLWSFASYAWAFNKALLSDVTTYPTANGGTYVQLLTPVLVNNTYTGYRPYQEIMITIDPTRANYDEGISLLLLGLSTAQNNGSGYQFAFDPPLPKNANNAITLTIRWTFERG